MKLSEKIQELKQNLDEIKSMHLTRLNEIENSLEDLKKSSNVASENWAGSWYQNTDVYNDFITRKNRQIQLSYEHLFDFFKDRSSIDFKSLDEELINILDEFQSYNEHLIVELSVIKANEQFSEQIKILDRLEDFEWGFPAFKIVNSQKPKKLIGDYYTVQKILANGLETPPHILYGANLLSSVSLIVSLRDFLKNSYRLLREIELLLNVENDEFIGADNPVVNLNRLLDNFHDVARLLVNRHAGRATLIISDEYDVQDLLHSLLKIFFADVRPEEYTPSYAGRNTRIDFLLKKERIVVEVKKTRNTLKDKEIGDELLQDIARYRNHPDCDILYCFVYDPQGFITNPRGLESDLTNESSEKMNVYVSIKP